MASLAGRGSPLIHQPGSIQPIAQKDDPSQNLKLHIGSQVVEGRVVVRPADEELEEPAPGNLGPLSSALRKASKNAPVVKANRQNELIDSTYDI